MIKKICLVTLYVSSIAYGCDRKPQEGFQLSKSAPALTTPSILPLLTRSEIQSLSFEIKKFSEHVGRLESLYKRKIQSADAQSQIQPWKQRIEEAKIKIEKLKKQNN